MENKKTAVCLFCNSCGAFDVVDAEDAHLRITFGLDGTATARCECCEEEIHFGRLKYMEELRNQMFPVLGSAK